ncbi:uncharacterized protein LOC134424953 isoform X1 [Melospiza melodia melodia]|uniref:uncharacterized protein LOC134424953 isoform X1 n=1 Tax=Melospiza melodia melodia TaxID=1914991 RepID=UPI002FD15E73
MIKGKRQVFGIYFRGFLRASQLVFCPPSPPAPERGSSAAPPHRQPRGGGHYASLPRRRRDRDLGSGSAGTRSGVPRWRHQGREKGAARPVPRTGCWAPRGRSGGIVREAGVASKAAPAAGRVCGASAEQAVASPRTPSHSRDGDGPSPARGNGSLQLNAQAEQHGSSRERWLCPGGSRSSGWICEPAAPGCRRTQGLHTPRAYRFARIVICKRHGKCHESSCGRWLRSNDKNVLQSWVQQSSFPTRQF